MLGSVVGAGFSRPGRLGVLTLALAAGVVCVVHTQAPGSLDEHLLASFAYRNLAPFRIQARIASIAVPERPEQDHRSTFYVAPWIGGVWKTTNAGTTFEPVFDKEPTQSIGAIAIAPSDDRIVWVGTGDAFTSRSSYAGDGVYKSTDAGATWTHLGLDDSQHIARIAIDPTNPDVAYVAAMGHLYSNNAERGVFKTTDGGAHWEKVLFINDRVGIIDLAMDPAHPATLYAAAYDKQRLPWQMVNGGPDSGIYKTTDAGKTWTKLEAGLPSGRIGRIGLALYPRDPKILYAVIENDNPRTTPAPAGRGGAPAGARSAAAPTIGGEVYRTEDGGATWRKMNAATDNVSSKGPYYFSQIFVDPNADEHVFVTGEEMGNSTDGGRTWQDITWPPRHLFTGMFGDVRTLWIDPENSNHMMQGSDGGVAISFDGGKTSRSCANIPIGSVYAVALDNDDPYNIYAGLQDHENWKGPSNGPMGHITDQDWQAVGDGDGIDTVPDPTDSRWLYTTREYGGHERLDQKLGIRTNIQPRPAPGEAPYRFLWEPPVAVSPHDSHTIYAGAQMLLKSTDQGDHWAQISPDLSTHPADKIMPESEGGVPGGIPWFAISTISESPLTAGLIWAGTSDGNVQVTRDGGADWTDVTPALTAAGLRADAYVSRVQASSYVAGRAYVSKSGYKLDDFRPYLATTDDNGATWRSIAANLPNQPIDVIAEDPVNPDVLFVGDDAGVFVSIDRGSHWANLNNGIPNLPIHDLAIQAREHDLVLGSYGRGIFVTNIAALEELTPAVLDEDAHLFTIPPTVQRIPWAFGANDYLFGQTHLETPNEPDGMAIRYYLKAAASGATIVITDAQGQQVARLNGPAAAGINAVVWSTRRGGGRGRGAGSGGGGPLDQWMPLGNYTVTLQVAGRTLAQPARIVKTQGWSIGATPQIIR